MKKKFDSSTKMSKVEPIKTTPKNEYLEKGKQLLDINTEGLTNLDDNVCRSKTEVGNLSNSIHEYRPVISEEIHKSTVEFGATLLCNFPDQIESKCKEVKRRMEEANNVILIPDTALYTLVITVVALSFFPVCMIRTGIGALHPVLIWRAVIYYIIVVAFGVSVAVIIRKFLDRGK